MWVLFKNLLLYKIRSSPNWIYFSSLNFFSNSICFCHCAITWTKTTPHWVSFGQTITQKLTLTNSLYFLVNSEMPLQICVQILWSIILTIQSKEGSSDAFQSEFNLKLFLPMWANISSFFQNRAFKWLEARGEVNKLAICLILWSQFCEI